MGQLVEKCLKGMAPSYFSNYFQFERHNVHDYDIRNKDKLVIYRVKHGAILYNEAEVFSLSITNHNGQPMLPFDWLIQSSLII